MKLKKYKKEDDFSYALGAFPTLELVKSKPSSIEKILIHSSFTNDEVIDKIKESVTFDKIDFNADKEIEKLSDKGNLFVIGIFKKYEMILDDNKDHLLLDNPSNMGYGFSLKS